MARHVYAVAPDGTVVSSQTNNHYTWALLALAPAGQRMVRGGKLITPIEPVWIRASMHSTRALAEKAHAKHPEWALVPVTDTNPEKKINSVREALTRAVNRSISEGSPVVTELPPPVTIPTVAEEEVPEGLNPLDRAAVFLLDLTYENAFEQQGADSNTFRCKICREENIPRQNRVNHFAVDRARSRAIKAQVWADRRATMPSTKTKKPTAKDQGVPDAYLADNGNFKPGLDARYKSDLITSILGEKNPKSLHTFEAADAQKRLEQRGWQGFLAKAKIAREAAVAKKASRAKKARANAAAKKTASTDGQVTPDPKPTPKPKRGLRSVA